MIDTLSVNGDNSIPETAVLVALVTREQTQEQVDEYLEELAFLATTLGTETKKMYTQKLEKPDIRTFVGKGKLEEIMEYVKAMDIGMVIFDDDLTPSQLRNLEKALKVRIYDRSLLILDIFLKRAQTAQAKTQVELARYQYLMPRLTRLWTHLERQRGGTGTRGGAGEKEIETDRRIIRNQINVLKKKLEKIEKQGEIQRKNRSNVVRAALVGYTNVGKSTLMRRLTKADVLAEDKLFATVDSTVRKVVIDQIPFLLSDTVGFIRKLPTHLIESFKSTLEEIREADILLHVIDVSHPNFEEHMQVVKETLSDIGATDKPTLLVFNKIDQYRANAEVAEDQVNGQEMEDIFEQEEPITIDHLKETFMARGEEEVVFISAQNKENMDELKTKLGEMVAQKHYTIFPNYLKHDVY
ncbi:GTPase HflX [Roseivirga sp. BDSF3-8]|uniref:GTPase HflX n=1 Tax=Roseivirga sp. BDSF3-8 TaxID=3241598 RepID=UPI0035326A6B